uniref:Uncharacterized protein n=1 Tax=Arundo donax TaxID=35708 RepID=A0A0A9GSK9_ARUDO
MSEDILKGIEKQELLKDTTETASHFLLSFDRHTRMQSNFGTKLSFCCGHRVN